MPTNQMNTLVLAPPASADLTVARSERRQAWPIVSIVCGLIAIGATAGIAWGLWLRNFQLGQPDPNDWYNVFYVLFARNEPVALGIVAIFSLASAAMFFRRQNAPEPTENPSFRHRPELLLAVIALLVFGATTLGTHLIAHDYALTADENLADFQAKIFLHGKTQAEVPAPWNGAIAPVRPTFVSYFPASKRWNASYLPVYALMRALFQSVNLETLLNPFLAAITVFALYGIAQKIWPNARSNALIAVILLASSSQFLLMSMTSYAMPAHLALNTIWLWLYSRSDRRIFYLAPVVGVLAIGLHQPIVHALFVAPFLFRLVLRRKWRAVSIFGVIYLAGCTVWLLWKRHYEAGGSGVGSIFDFRNPQMAFIQPMNLLLVIAWASLATPLLSVLGFRRFFCLPPLLQDAVLSCLLTFGFYFFFYADQAHGWGYRYFYGVLACFVLIATAGWRSLSDMVGAQRAKIFLGVGVAAALLVQFPLRCVQVESFVRPYARTAALLHAIPVDIVAFDPRDAWYSADLLRNDPFLQERPIIVSLLRVNPQQVPVLKSAGTVRFIDRETLARLGMPTTHFNEYKRSPFGLW